MNKSRFSFSSLSDLSERLATSPGPTFVNRFRWRRIAIALASVGVAWAVTMSLRPTVGAPLFFLPFTAAVAIAAWFGGLPAGLLATVVGLAVNAYEFAEPIGSFRVVNRADLVRMFVYVVVAMLVAVVIDARNRAARRYLEQREWWRVTLKSIGDAVIVTTADGRVVFMNKVSETLTGWSLDDASGRPLSEVFHIIHGVTREPVQSPVAQVVRSGLVMGVGDHTALVRRDGSELAIDDSAAPILDAQRHLVGVVLVFRDVTPLRGAERSLQRQADRLRLQAELLDHAYDAVFVRAVDDRIVYWNRTCEQLYGWSADEAMGKNAHDLLKTRFPTSLDEVRTVLERNGHWSGELVHAARDGTQRIVDSRHVMVHSELTRETRVLEINRDVTESRRAQQREALLLEASALLSSSLDADEVLKRLTRLAVPSLGDWAIVDVLQPDGQIRRVAGTHRDPIRQPFVERLFDHPPAEESPVVTAIRSQTATMRTDFSEDFLDRMATSPAHRDVLARLAPRSIVTAPLTARGRVLGAITFVYAESGREHQPSDIALAEAVARRAAIAVDNARLYRDAQDANRLKDEFLATLSHELRTPLNAIRGWTQMLLTGKLDEATVRRAYETIDRNAHAQTQIITDILDVSRIITGKLRLQVDAVDLADIIDTALDSVRPAAEAKRLDVTATCDVRPARLVGDRDRLQQILWNLLSNAVKFTPTGGRVEVRLSALDSRLQVRVTDSGVGIRPEFLPHVFERFTQSDPSASRPYGGLGLGLAISRHLAELHGGTIEAESGGQGQGATFTVTLPVRAATAEAAPNDDPWREPASGDSRPLAGLRVLVVDDESDARDLLGTILREHGAEVLLATSATEALVLVEREHPSVIVSDIGMPGEDGYELMARVRTLPAVLGGETPAIALTAYARGEDRLRALSAGYQQHVAKPVMPAELVVVVGAVARGFSRPAEG